MADGNYFDQFDAPAAQTPPAAQPTAGGNYFDQFDPPPTYDAAEFQRRVGRAPEAPELEDFKRNPSNWANDPNSRDPDTAAQGIVGGVDEFASLASGAAAQVPAGLAGIGYSLGHALGLTPTTGADAVEATQRALTYQPRTASGQEGVQKLSNFGGKVGDAIQAAGERAGLSSANAGAIVPVLQAGAAVAGLRGVGATAGAVTDTAAGAGALARRAGQATRDAGAGALERARGAIPQGTQFDAAGNAVTPSPARPAPLAADDVPGAARAAPPTYSPPQEAAQPSVESINAGLDNPASTEDTVGQARLASLQQLKQHGLTTVRNSAVSGDHIGAATDYASSKLDRPGGNAVAEQFANEKQALTNHADSLIAGTGGSVGTDSVTLGNRGEAIVRPLDDLNERFKTQERAAYQAADAAAQGQPVPVPSTSRLINGQSSMFKATKEGEQILGGIKTRARELGVWDDANNDLTPMTVQQAEQLRQYASSSYDPRSAKAVSAFKDALADDVTRAAGSDVYQQARAIRAERGRLLEQPEGIAKILDASGPDGVNRAVPVEKLPDTLLRMPNAQFDHVISTLEDMRKFDELQPQAAAALAEIRSHILQRAKETALPAAKEPWAAARFTKYLNDNAYKLARVLKPSELKQLRSLSDNGHILDVDRRYSGAAVQAHNLATRGKAMLAQHSAGAVGGGIGAAVGGHVGAAAGAWLGEQVGHKWAAHIEHAADRKGWAKRTQRI
jgi:hypothetical protein